MDVREMTVEEFEAYRTRAVAEYAEEHVKAGDWEGEGAPEKADEEFRSLLPNGVHTENHHLFSISEGETVIGMFWLAVVDKEKGWIYDIKLDESARGKGYGKETMSEIDRLGKDLGLRTIRLHVFGHNHIARQLYEKTGYRETNVIMEKELSD
ncbi:GNAT family N-acetyltransferase [Salimicrobium halophilum]|uniref:Protein N-acetyltransferase, RimJ/RimL family n=1 Tax=Salimicrobium halophilum TaxID=86666 RepID=A0A1G8RBA6_9BACI|nr:GNAT family N-acetyltransferase [Salimicrobium halophilum]SDJ14133.1 Protein N-acetyltransferase, RimJ/RimL family [Salimicrobium halophilum]